jgi:uncharacterized OB-fold protein
MEWRKVSGTGRLYSWIVVERQLHPSFPVPYTVVLVELDDAPGTRLVGNMAGMPKLEAGMRMQVRFDRLPDGTVLPQWDPQ